MDAPASESSPSGSGLKSSSALGSGMIDTGDSIFYLPSHSLHRDTCFANLDNPSVGASEFTPYQRVQKCTFRKPRAPSKQPLWNSRLTFRDSGQQGLYSVHSHGSSPRTRTFPTSVPLSPARSTFTVVSRANDRSFPAHPRLLLCIARRHRWSSRSLDLRASRRPKLAPVLPETRPHALRNVHMRSSRGRVSPRLPNAARGLLWREIHTCPGAMATSLDSAPIHRLAPEVPGPPACARVPARRTGAPPGRVEREPCAVRGVGLERRT